MKFTTLSRAIAGLCLLAFASTESLGQVYDSGTANRGAYSAATVGTSASTIVAAGAARVFLDLFNTSATATVCINIGATATITGTQCAAGEITLPPLSNKTWEGSYVPSDAISAIASASGTQFAIGVK
jgi:hypothetical protein